MFQPYIDKNATQGSVVLIIRYRVSNVKGLQNLAIIKECFSFLLNFMLTVYQTL